MLSLKWVWSLTFAQGVPARNNELVHSFKRRPIGRSSGAARALILSSFQETSDVSPDDCPRLALRRSCGAPTARLRTFRWRAYCTPIARPRHDICTPNARPRHDFGRSDGVHIARQLHAQGVHIARHLHAQCTPTARLRTFRWRAYCTPIARHLHAQWLPNDSHSTCQKNVFGHDLASTLVVWMGLYIAWQK